MLSRQNFRFGAIKAVCNPFCAWRLTAASAATTVFPEPTSPCNKRFIGRAFSMSWIISHSDRFCVDVVSSKGVFASIALTFSMRPRRSRARIPARAAFFAACSKFGAKNNFFKRESVARRRGVFDLLGEVHRVDRLVQFRESECGENVLRDPFLEDGFFSKQRLGHIANPARGESAGLGIHRHEASGVVHFLFRPRRACGSLHRRDC